MVKNSECENYEIKIKSVNKEEIKENLSICFQKKNGALTIIANKKIDEEITKKLVKDVSLALNKNPIASYNFKDLKKLGEIENLDYDIIVNLSTYEI